MLWIITALFLLYVDGQQLKWGQTKNQVFLTTSCDSITLSIDSFECDGVSFVLREDISIESSGCTKKSRGVTCHLTKAYPEHAWDTLVPGKKVAIDWAVWPDEDELVRVESGLPELSGTPRRDRYFVDLRMPWCHSCDSVLGEVEKLAKTFPIYQADVREERVLARNNEASCSYNCRLLAMPSETWVSIDYETLMRFMEDPWTSQGPVVPPALVCGMSDREREFEEAALSLQTSKIRFYKNQTATGIWAYGEDGSSFECTHKENLTECAQYGSTPSFVEDFDLRTLVPNQLSVVVPDEDDSKKEEGRLLADELRGLVTARLKVNDSYSFYEFGRLSFESFYGYTAGNDFKSPKYACDDAECIRRIVYKGEFPERRARRTAAEGDVVSATLDLSSDMLLVVYEGWKKEDKSRELRELLKGVDVRTFAAGVNELPDEIPATGYWLLPELVKCPKKKRKSAASIARWVASMRNLDGVEDALVERKTRKVEEKLLKEKAMPIRVADGVTMRVYVAGDGPLVKKKARVSYVGKYPLTNTVFDKSTSFVVDSVGAGQVIPCWDIALKKMHVGDRVILECEKDQAYGDQDLEFDIHVLSLDDDDEIVSDEGDL